MKKISALCLTLAGAAIIPLSACNTEKSGNLSSVNDVYGLGAVTSAKLLSNVSGQTVKALASVSLLADGADEAAVYAEKFNEYFTALDDFLGEDLINTVAEENKDEKYPYETKLTVTGKDISGNDVTHIMYYTETFAGEERDEDEVKTIYTLEGVMIVDGEDYYLTGEREHETEEDETEDELKIRAYADRNDKSTYVEMEQETSREPNETEREYTYSVYSAGRLVEKTSVEFETERKGAKEEAEYELEFLNGSGKGKYKVERETVGGTVQMKVKYKIDGKEGVFKIRKITDKDGNERYEYTFSDNSTKVV